MPISQIVTNSIADDVTIKFADGSASTPPITNNGDTNTGIFFPAADTIAFAEGGTESMRLDSSGNVGIGTSSPALRTTIQSASELQLDLYGTAGSFASGIQFRNNNSANGQFKYVNGAFVWDNGNGSAERMRITSSGFVGINTTPSNAYLQVNTPSASTAITARFQHPGDATFGTIMSLETTGGSDPPALSFRHHNGGSPTNYSISLSSSFLRFNSAGSETSFGTLRFSFDNAGNAFKSSGAGSWLALSDERVKTNIQDVEGGLSRILKLRPRTFDYKQPEAHNGISSDKGFIAQEFETVYPNSVAEADIVLEQDKQYFVDDKKAKSIGFNAEFYADLTSAIQELKATVDAQAAQIAALKEAK
jgi:hypothetical protein